MAANINKIVKKKFYPNSLLGYYIFKIIILNNIRNWKKKCQISLVKIVLFDTKD